MRLREVRVRAEARSRVKYEEAVPAGLFSRASRIFTSPHFSAPRASRTHRARTPPPLPYGGGLRGPTCAAGCRGAQRPSSWIKPQTKPRRDFGSYYRHRLPPAPAFPHPRLTRPPHSPCRRRLCCRWPGRHNLSPHPFLRIRHRLPSTSQPAVSSPPRHHAPTALSWPPTYLPCGLVP